MPKGVYERTSPSPRFVQLMGEQFGRLLVLGYVGSRKWWCRCVCGQETIADSRNLKQGRTQSCGCLKEDGYADLNVIHGHSRRDKDTPTYITWCGMIQRCTNPNHEAYSRYGGGGITVCPEWRTFQGFLADMGERPEGTTLGRFGDVGNYEPGNVAWQTDAEQKTEARLKRIATAA